MPLLCFFLLLFCAAVASAVSHEVVLKLPEPPHWKRRRFDLRSDADLTTLMNFAKTMVEVSARQDQELQRKRARTTATRPFFEMTQRELKEYFDEPDWLITKRDRRGLKDIQRLVGSALNADDPARRRQLADSIQGLAAAINNNHAAPAPGSLDLVEVPWVFWDQWRNPVARGRTAAANLERAAGGEADLSTLDPRPSTFWRRPGSIPGQDLYHGFGRTERPNFENEFCVYLAPKTGYGANPGFEVQCGRREIKVKFAESTSEPFAARVFRALGYHVDPTDHAPRLRVRYDRRLLREFHLRKEIKTQFRLFVFVRVHTMQLQRRYDPFDYVAEAVLKDGSRVSGTDLKRRLFRDPDLEHPEDFPENFKPEVEREIDHLVTVRANIQVKDAGAVPVGPWDFGQLGHEDLRELRGLALLAAWLGWYDSRFENTRLKIVAANGRRELVHYLSDVGGGLGRGAGFYSGRGELPNEFEWTFTQAPIVRGKGRMTTPFRITGFKPIKDTLAFEEMTIDDARWMARLIAQLTEEQIVQALVASGFDSARVRLYTEKLISRRDQMIRDLGLAHEIALLRPNGVELNLSYDPGLEGPVSITLAGGVEIVAPIGELAVKEGGLVTSERAVAEVFRRAK